MSTDIHETLLRPAVLQILRATGFNHARPGVIEAVTDLAARYLLLLSATTVQSAQNNHQTSVPTVQDVRTALTDLGALSPQMSAKEERAKGQVEVAGTIVAFEDLRGVDGFVSWAQGSVNKEIRRIAGYGDDEMNVEQIAAGTDDKEDYLTVLKKHGKTDEDGRYQGTVLGKDSELQAVSIMGTETNSLKDWLQTKVIQPSDIPLSPATSGISSAPLTPMDSGVRTPPEG